MIKAFKLCVFFLVCTTGVASAQTAFSVLRDDITYDVKIDGTYTCDEIESLGINTEAGVKQKSQMSFRYSSSLQELEILEAYTTTKGGQRIDVTPDKIMLQQSPQSVGAPTFSDFMVKTVVFPAVEPGVTLNIHARKTQKTPVFPNAFSMLEVIPKETDIRSTQITLRAPQAMNIYVDAIDLSGGQVEPDAAGTKKWHWSIENPLMHLSEAGSVSPIDFSPRVTATSFPSYAALAKAYLDRSAAKAAVTPTIQQLADQITQGVEDKRAQAEALYRWVSKDIRYVAIFLDFGGWVPHSADEIAQAKYGDCKDHVTLLQALLEAKGIQSSAVLVNASNVYWLPKVASTDGVFDHAITYIPAFDVYLDSTAEVASFGTLPIQERGKSALIVHDGSAQPKVVTLPLTDTKTDTVRVESKLTVDEEGTVTGESKIVSSGVFDLVGRQIFALIPQGNTAQFANRVLLLTGQTGTGNYVHNDTTDLSTPFVYWTQFKLENYVSVPGPGAMAVPVGLGSLSSIASTFDGVVAPTRAFDMPFVNGRREEITTIVLPATVKIMALPKPVTLDTALGHYESSYAKTNDSTFVIKRALDIHIATATIKSEEYAVLHTMGAAVARDLKTQMLYQ